MYVYKYIHMYVHLYVCICIYTYIHTYRRISARPGLVRVQPEPLGRRAAGDARGEKAAVGPR